nr:vacuolar ATP synthase catalytic subunit-related / V-ATPase-related / vacuolar proton pump-like protein [Ipomoea batatas]GMC87814.1 vacuolar ATP synthase catalytic subunit-related / V-ATPase-related / vacuolar proton pump-like protein [Ipomoea batatas]
MAHVSDIKLIRTDTTLDLSQKAEKGMQCPNFDWIEITAFFPRFLDSSSEAQSKLN